MPNGECPTEIHLSENPENFMDFLDKIKEDVGETSVDLVKGDIGIHFEFNPFVLHNKKGEIEYVPAIEITQICSFLPENKKFTVNKLFFYLFTNHILIENKIKYILEENKSFFEKSFKLNENKSFFYIRSTRKNTIITYGLISSLFNMINLSCFKNREGNIMFDKICIQLIDPYDISENYMEYFNKKIFEYINPYYFEDIDPSYHTKLLKVDMHIWDFRKNIDQNKYISLFCFNKGFRCHFYT